MRIVGGEFRGRRIVAPEGMTARPTTDRVREALFNIIDHSEFDLQGARVLDLFAGSGALGLEALSRGAAFALFVDDHAKSRGAVRENIEALGLTGCTKIFRRDATSLGALPSGMGGPFNLIFLDPPYGQGLIERALQSARDGGWLDENSLIVCESGAEEVISLAELTLLDTRLYGDTKLQLATTK